MSENTSDEARAAEGSAGPAADPVGPRATRDQTRAVIVALALGVVLRLWQWGAQTGMWLDELWIAQNIRDRGLVDLLGTPLANRQMAPPGFLASVELSTSLFGLSELALRLVPMLVSLLALYLVWRVAARFVGGLPLFAVVLTTAVSPALIWYSGNVKQYSGDVAFSLLIVLFGLRYLEGREDRRRAITAGLLGAAAILSSHAAVLTAFVVGLLLTSEWSPRRDRLPSPAFVWMHGLWAAAAGLHAWWALSFTSGNVRGFMRDFWADGLAPWSDGPVRVLAWIPERLFNTLAHYLVFVEQAFGTLAAPLALLAVLGLRPLWRRHGVRGLVLMAPVLAALLGGLARVFPMDHRLAVHAGSSLVILAMVGLQALSEHRSAWVRRPGWVLGAIAVLPLPVIVLLTSRPPLRAPDTRVVLEEVVPRMGDTDALYAYCYAEPAADFYGLRVGLESYSSLDCPTSTEELRRSIDEMPGGRVWFLFTRTPEARMVDEAIDILSERGDQLDVVWDRHAPGDTGDAAAYLFEIPGGD